MNANSKIFRKSLQEAIGVFKSPEETTKGMEQFDQLSKDGDRENMAMEVVLNSLGLQESKSGVAEYVSRELSKLGNHPKPETDSLKRIRALLLRLQKNIQSGAITVNGQDLSDFARKEAALKIAPCLLLQERFTYSATATVNGKTSEFVIETIE